MPDLRYAFIVGARPNFVKIAPILRAFAAYAHVQTRLVHTGQHYDKALSDVFFEELEIPRPDESLGVGSGSHGQQTGKLIPALEDMLVRNYGGGGECSGVVVVGDVNSTMAAALAAAKLNVPVHHVEAGLRSFDRTMPEEINRLVTDALSDRLFVSEPEGVENLRREGRDDDRVHLVGNVMIDTLLRRLPAAHGRDTLARHEVTPGGYGVVTLHRPSNVDDPETLSAILDVLTRTAERLPLVFPVHPRTAARLEEFGLKAKLDAAPGIKQAGPAAYLDFLCLTSQAKLIVTDSGGLQEESTVLKVPCLTMRANTERPVTVTEGSSTLVSNDAAALAEGIEQVLGGTYKPGRVPELWDGKAAERIAAVLAESAV